jgi:hypothetical protein
LGRSMELSVPFDSAERKTSTGLNNLPLGKNTLNAIFTRSFV